MAQGVNIKIDIQGMPDVLKALEAIDKKYRTKGLRRAVNKGSQLILKAAKNNLNRNRSVDTKMLLKSLGYKVKRYGQGLIWVGIIGPRKDTKGKPKKYSGLRVRRSHRTPMEVNPIKYAHLVEYGTKPHHIGKHSSIRYKRRFGKVHPGARAKPFLRPAYDQNAGAVASVMMAELQKTLAEIS